MVAQVGYLGNPLLKGVAHTIEWTPEMVEEFRKCKESPEYFARTYIQIVHVDRGMINFIPYDYQEQIIKTVHENRFTILCCSRQSGKCFEGNQLLTIRNKKTGEIQNISANDFKSELLGADTNKFGDQ